MLTSINNNSSIDTDSLVFDELAKEFTCTIKSAKFIKIDDLRNKLIAFLTAKQIELKQLSIDTVDVSSENIIDLIMQGKDQLYINTLIMEGIKQGIKYTVDVLCTIVVYGLIDCIDILLDSGININSCDYHRMWTPLMYATSAEFSGNLDIAKILISRGANVNAKGAGNTTALITANGRFDCCEPLKNYNNQIFETTQLLLISGANVNDINRDGINAFYNATTNGYYKSMKLLANSGAAIDCCVGNKTTIGQWLVIGPNIGKLYNFDHIEFFKIIIYDRIEASL